VGDTLYRAAAVNLTGSLGETDIGWNLNGSIAADTLAGPVSIGHHLAGTLAFTGAGAVNESVSIGRDLRGTLSFAGPYGGVITIGDDLGRYATLAAGPGSDLELHVADDLKTGFDIDGSISRLEVGDTLYRAAAVNLTGSLGVVTIGERLNGVLHADTLTGSLEAGLSLNGTLRLDSAAPCAADISIGGHLNGTLDIAGIGAGATLSVGGDVRSDLLLGEVLGSIVIGDDLRGDLTITGNLGQEAGGGLLSVADEATGAIDLLNAVYGEILVGGYLAYLDSHGQAQPADPGLAPIDYVFMVAGEPEGTLTVNGPLGLVT